MVAKNFTGGTLSSLQPTTSKEGKSAQRMRVEVKVTGATLGEVISFVKSADSMGFSVGKLHLSQPPANPATLDLQATVSERPPNG
jgi:hypothetical protein